MNKYSKQLNVVGSFSIEVLKEAVKEAEKYCYVSYLRGIKKSEDKYVYKNK